jgi:hypothetical protein
MIGRTHLLTLCVLAVCAVSAHGEAVFYESFDYTAGEKLGGSWVGKRDGTLEPMLSTASTGLTFTGYISSGNAADVSKDSGTKATTGDEGPVPATYAPFVPGYPLKPTTGYKFYMSYMVQVPDANAAWTLDWLGVKISSDNLGSQQERPGWIIGLTDDPDEANDNALHFGYRDHWTDGDGEKLLLSNPVQAHTTYFVLAEMGIDDDGNSVTKLKIYEDGETLPSSLGDVTWDLETLDGGRDWPWGSGDNNDVEFTYVGLVRDTTARDALIDEIRIDSTFEEVIPVPEPATMSLLGLGGLVALRRRRR